MRCQTCARLMSQITWASGEVAGLRRSLATRWNANRADLHEEYLRQRASRDDLKAMLEVHRDECDASAHSGTSATSRLGKGLRRPAGSPPKSKPGQERCPVCRKAVKPLASGFLRKHADPQGYPCTNRQPQQVAS